MLNSLIIDLICQTELMVCQKDSHYNPCKRLLGYLSGKRVFEDMSRFKTLRRSHPGLSRWSRCSLRVFKRELLKDQSKKKFWQWKRGQRKRKWCCQHWRRRKGSGSMNAYSNLSPDTNIFCIATRIPSVLCPPQICILSTGSPLFVFCSWCLDWLL